MSIDQWDIEQIQAALAAAQQGVTAEHLEAVRCFIQQIGGIENAHAALRLLEQQEAA